MGLRRTVARSLSGQRMHLQRFVDGEGARLLAMMMVQGCSLATPDVGGTKLPQGQLVWLHRPFMFLLRGTISLLEKCCLPFGRSTRQSVFFEKLHDISENVGLINGFG